MICKLKKEIYQIKKLALYSKYQLLNHNYKIVARDVPPNDTKANITKASKVIFNILLVIFLIIFNAKYMQAAISATDKILDGTTPINSENIPDTS